MSSFFLGFQFVIKPINDTLSVYFATDLKFYALLLRLRCCLCEHVGVISGAAPCAVTARLQDKLP